MFCVPSDYRDGDSVGQGLHTFHLCLHSGEVTPVPLLKATATSSKFKVFGCYCVPPVMRGRTVVITLASHCLHQARYPKPVRGFNGRLELRQTVILTSMLPLSELECHDYVSWPIWQPPAGWRIQENGHHQLWVKDAQHWHWCSTGNWQAQRTQLSLLLAVKRTREATITWCWMRSEKLCYSPMNCHQKEKPCILSLQLSDFSRPGNILSIMLSHSIFQLSPKINSTRPLFYRTPVLVYGLQRPNERRFLTLQHWI